MPHSGASNEYPQHMFPWRNKKTTMWIPPVTWSSGTPMDKLGRYSAFYTRVTIFFNF